MKDPLNITLNEVNRVASEFLRTHHPSLKIPVPIENILEIKMNIQIILIPRLIRDFGVNAFITQDFKRIIVDEANYTKQPERMRFTFAEEIGHKILHEEWYRKNGPKDIKDFLKWQNELDGKRYSFIENQAKTFSSMVLMPQQVILTEWDKFTKKTGIPSPCNVFDIYSSQLRLQLLTEIV